MRHADTHTHAYIHTQHTHTHTHTPQHTHTHTHTHTPAFPESSTPRVRKRAPVRTQEMREIRHALACVAPRKNCMYVCVFVWCVCVCVCVVCVCVCVCVLKNNRLTLTHTHTHMHTLTVLISTDPLITVQSHLLHNTPRRSSSLHMCRFHQKRVDGR